MWQMVEAPDGRQKILTLLVETVRSHYEHLDRIAEDAKRLGYDKAAEILRTRMPQTDIARSGDLGEILASELAGGHLGYRIPVKRLRFKDGREMALRGDDFLGVTATDGGGLRLLKGESKSRKTLDKTTITGARETLNRDDGRCTPESLLFVADRLLDSADADDQTLGRVLRDEVGTKMLPPGHIAHMLFTFSGNAPPPSLKEDLDASQGNRDQFSVNLRIEDHSDFIKLVFIKAMKLGNV
jgi:hypothetical protein